MIPSPEEMIRRFDAACTEAGWPNVRFTVAGTMHSGWPKVVVGRNHTGDVPAAVYWMACDIAYMDDGDPYACWPCWQASTDAEYDDDSAWRCAEGDCAHPEGPSRPPRELLRAS